MFLTKVSYVNLIELTLGEQSVKFQIYRQLKFWPIINS